MKNVYAFIIGLLLITNISYAEKYWWRGGSGNWIDANTPSNHWSTDNEGNLFSNVTPGATDTVYFSDNSFVNFEDTILITGSVSIHTIDFSGVSDSYNPVLFIDENTQLHINGSLTMAPTLKIKFSTNINSENYSYIEFSGNSDQYFITNDHTFYIEGNSDCLIKFNGSGITRVIGALDADLLNVKQLSGELHINNQFKCNLFDAAGDLYLDSLAYMNVQQWRDQYYPSYFFMHDSAEIYVNSYNESKFYGTGNYTNVTLSVTAPSPDHSNDGAYIEQSNSFKRLKLKYTSNSNWQRPYQGVLKLASGTQTFDTLIVEGQYVNGEGQYWDNLLIQGLDNQQIPALFANKSGKYTFESTCIDNVSAQSNNNVTFVIHAPDQGFSCLQSDANGFIVTDNSFQGTVTYNNGQSYVKKGWVYLLTQSSRLIGSLALDGPPIQTDGNNDYHALDSVDLSLSTTPGYFKFNRPTNSWGSFYIQVIPDSIMYPFLVTSFYDRLYDSVSGTTKDTIATSIVDVHTSINNDDQQWLSRLYTMNLNGQATGTIRGLVTYNNKQDTVTNGFVYLLKATNGSINVVDTFVIGSIPFSDAGYYEFVNPFAAVEDTFYVKVAPNLLVYPKLQTAYFDRRNATDTVVYNLENVQYAITYADQLNNPFYGMDILNVPVLKGTITYNNGQNTVDLGAVYLLAKDRFNNINVVDTFNLSAATAGQYEFLNPGTGNFYVKVAPDQNLYPQLYESYYYNNIGGVDTAALQLSAVMNPIVLNANTQITSTYNINLYNEPIPVDSIKGLVTYAAPNGALPLDSGKVYLLRATSVDIPTIVDSITLATTDLGHYRFADPGNGNFYISVKPEASLYPQLTTAYFDRRNGLDSAVYHLDSVHYIISNVDQNWLTYTYNINIKPQQQPLAGTIHGTITYTTTNGDFTLDSGKVYLLKQSSVAGGQATAIDSLVLSVANVGNYAFNNPGAGNYYIKVQPIVTAYPNLPSVYFDRRNGLDTAVTHIDSVHYVISNADPAWLTYTYDIHIKLPQQPLTGKLQGFVTYTSNGTTLPVDSGVVYLLKETTSGNFAKVDSFQLYTTAVPRGFYEFNNPGNGNFYIQVLPNAAYYNELLPVAYYDRQNGVDVAVNFWDSVHYQISNTDPQWLNYVYNINIQELNLLNGTAVISGYILDGGGFVLGGRLAGPGNGGHNTIQATGVRGVKVILSKEPSGGTVAMRITQDNSGYYEFKNVPPGTYKVIPDLPGLDPINYHTVTVGASDTVIHVDYIADSVKVYKVDTATTVITALYKHAVDVSKSNSVLVYPNPVSTEMTLLINTTSVNQTALVNMSDIVGRRMMNPIMLKLNKGNNSFIFDASSYPEFEKLKGTFIVTIIVDGQHKYYKMVKE